MSHSKLEQQPCIQFYKSSDPYEGINLSDVTRKVARKSRFTLSLVPGEENNYWTSVVTVNDFQAIKDNLVIGNDLTGIIGENTDMDDVKHLQTALRKGKYKLRKGNLALVSSRSGDGEARLYIPQNQSGSCQNWQAFINDHPDSSNSGKLKVFSPGSESYERERVNFVSQILNKEGILEFSEDYLPLEDELEPEQLLGDGVISYASKIRLDFPSERIPNDIHSETGLSFPALGSAFEREPVTFVFPGRVFLTPVDQPDFECDSVVFLSFGKDVNFNGFKESGKIECYTEWYVRDRPSIPGRLSNWASRQLSKSRGKDSGLSSSADQPSSK